MEYIAPETLAEAVAALSPTSGREVVAGGTDLVVGVRSGRRPMPRGIVAIHRLSELRGISSTCDRARIGAVATHAELLSHPVIRREYAALADAASMIGSPATRAVGTLGGNLANASPAMDTGAPLLVFDATVELASDTGRRTMPLEQFLLGPGRTALDPGELLTAVHFASQAGAGSAYLRLEYRQAMEIAIVGAAAYIALDEGDRCAEARLAISAVAPRCVRVQAAEAELVGHALTPPRIDQAVSHVRSVAAPIDDVRASADYRYAMLDVIVKRAIRLALRRAIDHLPWPADAEPRS